MSNKVNDTLYEQYLNDGIDGGLNEIRASHYAGWRLERENFATVDEYLDTNPFDFDNITRLNDKINTLTRRNDILERKIILYQHDQKQIQQTCRNDAKKVRFRYQKRIKRIKMCPNGAKKG